MKYVRLKKQSDFQKLFKSGKRIFSSSLTMIIKPSKELTMGISIGKKHGKAVQRNRIKRLLRESFAATADEWQGNYHVVLIPKVADEYSLKTFKAHLQWMIKKNKL
ncbi:MAG: ribonuclease P protein component [Clostridia bacterium]|nr:ribonuclease P protein component [Clostridia bacterium]